MPLPGDQPGYWGEVTGFDFCERNYTITQYVGELWCMLTNFVSLPVYVIMFFYVRSHGVKMAPLTICYLIFAFLDMFFAGLSHGLLKMPFTHAQEWVLEVMYILFFVIMYQRYHGDIVCKITILIIVGSRVIDGGIEVVSEGFNSKFTGSNTVGEVLGYAVPIISLLGMVVLLIKGRGFIERFLAAEILIIVPAFYTFMITEVHAGNCYRLPIWLHEVGHLLGGLSDFCSLVVAVGLDPEVKESMHIGLKYWCLPGIFPGRADEENEAREAMTQSMQQVMPA